VLKSLHGIYSTPHLRYTSVAATTVCKITPDDGRKLRPKHVVIKNQINRKSCISLVFYKSGQIYLVVGDNSPALGLNGAILQCLGGRMFSGAP